MKLSVVVPCYNEGENVIDFYKEIKSVKLPIAMEMEIVFVNDGSRDNTLATIKELADEDHRVFYISFSRNFGKEAAMLAGMEYARGDAVVIIDADLQHPPELIPELVEKFFQGYDQVIAKRTRKGESKTRSILSRLYYKLIDQLTDVELTDGIGDFRLLSRKALNALLALREYNRFSKGIFSWIGFKEYVIEYDNIVRETGESKWTFAKLLNYGIDGVLSFNNKPLRISIYIGLLVMIVSVVYVMLMSFRVLYFGVDVPGYFTTMASVLLLSGIQFVFLGVIGEYIGRIYTETKRRPIYIVDEKNFSSSKEELRSKQFLEK